VDNLGDPVFEATVTGEFTGDIPEPGVTEITDSNGQAVFITKDDVHGRLKFTFCVENVTHATLEYNDGEICDSN